MQRQFIICVFLSYTILVTYLSLSAPDTIVNISAWDKIAHMLAYIGFSILARLIAKNYRQLLGLLFFCIGFGIAIELLQGLTPERVSSVADVIANISGLLGGTVIAHATLAFFKRMPLQKSA